MLFQLRIGNRGAFWLVVNHWKSQMGNPRSTEQDRVETARQIGEFYTQFAVLQSDAMLLVGDFIAATGRAEELPGHPATGD